MKQLLRKEKTALRHRSFHLRSLVDFILYEEFGRRLYNLSQVDELRLFKLITWRDRYLVSIRFILKTLVPYYAKRFERYSSKKSLGCKIGTLLGKKSELILKDAVQREFPNRENEELIRQDLRLEIYKIEEGELEDDEDEEDLVVRTKSPLQFKTPKAYVRYYSNRVMGRRKDLQKGLENAKRRERVWRNNPFL